MKRSSFIIYTYFTLLFSLMHIHFQWSQSHRISSVSQTTCARFVHILGPYLMTLIGSWWNPVNRISTDLKKNLIEWSKYTRIFTGLFVKHFIKCMSFNHPSFARIVDGLQKVYSVPIFFQLSVNMIFFAGSIYQIEKVIKLFVMTHEN